MNERTSRSASTTVISTQSPSHRSIHNSPLSPIDTSPTRRVSSRGRTTNSPVTLSRPPISARNSSYRSPKLRSDSIKSSASTMASEPPAPSRHDPRGSDSGTTSIVNPTSTILQGLIKEQRATRGSRRTVSEYLEDAAMVTPPASRSNEESASDKQRKVNTAMSTGLKQPREMGIREMDQYVSKMNKLNFDLKLEIFHRTQQMKALEKKVERMHEIEEELERMQNLEDEVQELRAVEDTNQRLREANEQLQLELDKRDLAINEAVELICQLENKIEELQSGRDDDSRPSTARPRDGDDELTGNLSLPEVSTPKAQISVEIPDRTSSKRGTVRRPRKSPSFLRSESKSTSALRSLYFNEENQSLRSVSASTQATSKDFEAELESPRLSILSNCSFLDPYDPPLGSKEAEASETNTQSSLPEDIPSASPSLTDNGCVDDLEQINKWISSAENLFIKSGRKPRSRAVSRGDDETQESSGPNQEVTHTLNSTESLQTYYLETPRMSNVPHFGGQLPPTPDTMRTCQPGGMDGSTISIRGHSTMSIRAASCDRSTLCRDLSRPRTADGVTTRPSSPMSHMSDGAATRLSECGEYSSSSQERQDVAGLFHSFNYFGRASTKAVRLPDSSNARNTRPASYGGDLMFNGEGIEEIRSADRAKLQSSKEPLATTKPALQLMPSQEQLSAQDWLDAARARPWPQKELVQTNPAERSRRAGPTVKLVEPSVTAMTASSGRPKTADSQDKDLPNKDDSQTRRNPALRLRAWANNPSVLPDSQPKRRFSLRPRFLSRSVTSPPQQHTETMADHRQVDQATSTNPANPANTNILRRHRRSGSGPTSFNNVHGSVNGQEDGQQLLQAPTHVRPATAVRPTTSDCADHRRGPSGLFGWMKGTSGSGSQNTEAENTIKNRASVMSVRTTTNNSKLQSEPVTTRPDMYAPSSTTGMKVAEITATCIGAAEEESDWRSRRRSRRMA